MTYLAARAVKALERKDTFRDRCRHISDLSVKVLPPSALMKSALPLLTNALASRAV